MARQATEEHPQDPQELQPEDSTAAESSSSSDAAELDAEELDGEELDAAELDAEDAEELDDEEGDAPEFAELGDEEGEEPAFEEMPEGDDDLADVVPFTSEEIVNGSAYFVMFGLQRVGYLDGPMDEDDGAAFARGYANVSTMPPIRTAQIIEALEVGEALAQYGIHRNMAAANMVDRLASLPAWLRIVVGAGGLGLAGMNAVRSVENARSVRVGRPGDDNDAGAQAAGHAAD